LALTFLSTSKLCQDIFRMCDCHWNFSSDSVATLTLGLRPKQRGCKVVGQEEAQESHHILSQPYFGQVWGWSPTLGKSEDLESFGTPECSELDSKAQNTSHWGVLGVIGKVLKLRYRKWPRIGHLDICRPSYGQKKGRESNWQFDSRPLKVRNRPLSNLLIESAIRRWKDLDEGYKFGLDLVVIRPGSRELWPPKVPGFHPGHFRDIFGTISRLQLGSPGKKSHLDVVPEMWRIEYYMGEGGGFPRVWAVVCLVVQSARGLSQHPRVSRNVN